MFNAFINVIVNGVEFVLWIFLLGFFLCFFLLVFFLQAGNIYALYLEFNPSL